MLVVEDEVGIATSLKRGFTADGFDVDVAGDGIAGLELARANAYDIIVLDIMLPGIDGHRVCAELRRGGGETPVLMLTAKDTDHDIADGLDLGADDYVVKPFSYVVLLSRVNALLRRVQHRQAARVIEVGDLRLDLDTQQASRQGQLIDLSPRSLALLHHLMANAGNVVSKDAILSAVWDQSFDGDGNIVEVYISRLRRAIDIPFDCTTLETVRGLGYRLAAARRQPPQTPPGPDGE